MTTAHDILATIAADLGLDASALTAEDRRRIRAVLEDGAALAALGITDGDQEAVEEAYDLVKMTNCQRGDIAPAAPWHRMERF